MCSLAIFTVLAFARSEHIFTHLGLASRFDFLVGSAIVASICVVVLCRAFSSYFFVSYHVVTIHEHILVNSFLTEIGGILGELFKFFDVFFHVLDMAAIRILFGLKLHVQVLDTFVQEHILAVSSMIERANFLDVKTNRCESDTTFKSISHEILVRDILGMPLFNVGFFRKLKAIVKANFDLPSTLDGFLSLSLYLSLFLDDLSCLRDLILGIFITVIEC